MAAIAQYFQTPNNITSGTWNWGDVAFGFRSGLLLNEAPLSMIQYNNLEFPRMLDALALTSFVMIPLSTSANVAKLARSENWIAQYKKTFSFGALALMGANGYTAATKVYTRKFSQARTPFQKFLAVAWKTTPYLMLLTNIALTIIELRVNRMKAAVSLAVLTVTCLNHVHVLPRSFARYLNPGIRLPMDFIALYYGSNKNRFSIVLGWAGVPLIRDPIMAWLKPYLSRLS